MDHACVYLYDSTTNCTNDNEDRQLRPETNLCGNKSEYADQLKRVENKYRRSVPNDPTDITCPYAYAVTPLENCEQEYLELDKETHMYSEDPNIKCNLCPQITRNRSFVSSGSSGSSLISRIFDQRSKIHSVAALMCMQILVLVLLSLIIVLFVMLFNLKHDLKNEKSERLEDSNKLCLPCNDLILGPLEEDNTNLNLLTKRHSDGMDICCAKGWNQTSILMDLLFKRKNKLSQAEEIIKSETNCRCNISGNAFGSSTRAASHLLVGIQPVTDGAPPYAVHNWIDDGPTAHSSGINVKDSLVIVNTSGLYFVYSQILFSNLYKPQSSVNTTQALYHYVYRWNYIYPNDGNELLLKSVRTQCWAVNRVYGDYTSYTAGVFKLNAGDQLFVKTSNIELISRDQQSSFFGIVKL